MKNNGFTLAEVLITLGIIGVVFAPAIAALAVVLIEEIYMKSIE